MAIFANRMANNINILHKSLYLLVPNKIRQRYAKHLMLLSIFLNYFSNRVEHHVLTGSNSK